MALRSARVLILCKTYPSPSARYVETSCVAGLEEGGGFIRLYPVPFRLIADSAKFKKWQWINATVRKAKNDHRPESYRIGVDTIVCDDQIVSAKTGWADRWRLLERISIFENFADLESARANKQITLGMVRPSRILGLDITPTAPDWTDEEKQKLSSAQEQTNLFESVDDATRAALRKLPFDFHYRYGCCIGDEEIIFRHKIVDWEIGALYWNVRRQHGEKWEAPFRKKLEDELPSRDLIFFMGTIHRFPDQWLIVSLIYPPKRLPSESNQLSLF